MIDECALPRSLTHMSYTVMFSQAAHATTHVRNTHNPRTNTTHKTHSHPLGMRSRCHHPCVYRLRPRSACASATPSVARIRHIILFGRPAFGYNSEGGAGRGDQVPLTPLSLQPWSCCAQCETECVSPWLCWQVLYSLFLFQRIALPTSDRISAV